MKHFFMTHGPTVALLIFAAAVTPILMAFGHWYISLWTGK